MKRFNKWYDDLPERARFSVFALLTFPWIIAGAFWPLLYLPLLPLLLMRVWWIHWA